MEIVLDQIIKILIALVLGAVIGVEREFYHKPAGLRTHILVCMGATLAASLSTSIFPQDPARIAANIITGIGFLGAGAIIGSAGNVKGITTAASLWVMAMIGMAVGFGQYLIATITTIIVLIVLLVMGNVELKAKGNNNKRKKKKPLPE